LLVFVGKLVSVAQHDLPLAVFTAVGLGTAKCPGPRAISDVAGHVLQVDGVGQVIPDDRHDIFRGAIGGLDAYGGPVEPGTHLRVRLFKKYLISGYFGHAARLRRSMVASS